MEDITDIFLGRTNDTTPRATGLTRGLVAAALVGSLNAVLIFLPFDPEQKVSLLAALNPVIILTSYVVYGFVDHVVKHNTE